MYMHIWTMCMGGGNLALVAGGSRARRIWTHIHLALAVVGCWIINLFRKRCCFS